MVRNLYQQLMTVKNNKRKVEYIMVSKIYNTRFHAIREFSSLELQKLLLDNILGPYFVKYFINNINQFSSFFSISEAVNLLAQMKDDKLKECYVSNILDNDGKNEFLSLIMVNDKLREKFQPIFLRKLSYLIAIISTNYQLSKEDKESFWLKKHGKFLYGIPIEFMTWSRLQQVINNLPLVRYSTEENYNVVRLIEDKETLTNIYHEIFSNEKVIEKIPHNMKEILSNFSIPSIYFPLMNYLSTKCYSQKIEKNNDMKQIIKKIFSRVSEKEVLLTLKLIVEEFLNLSHCSIENIEYLGEGSSSKVFKIGDFVLKVGNSNRVTDTIPNHPLIIQPLFRR